MISFESSGDLKTEKWLKKISAMDLQRKLDKYGRAGVRALAKATPKDTSETALSWGYRIVPGKGGVAIEWFNDHVVDGVCIAVIIQYGHATGTGGYVQGIDYINPAVKPIFEAATEDFWKEVTA